MELKRLRLQRVCCTLVLLIVPYGIETFLVKTMMKLPLLLIVPYGIETSNRPDSNEGMVYRKG